MVKSRDCVKEIKMWTKGHELKYWEKTGIQKGISIYHKYRKAFNLDKIDFSGKIIGDIGCGPFGGVFCDVNDIEVIPVDILYEEYNKMGYSSRKIVYGDLNERLPFEDNFFDYIICTNAIDHIKDVKKGFDEIWRVLKKEGIVFVHVHLRKKEELNKAHIHELDKNKIRSMINRFIIISIQENNDWVNEELNRSALYLELKKK